MHSLRLAHRLACFVLAWFVLSLGVAVASPLVHPKAGELICSGSGVMKLLVTSDDGTSSTASPFMDCPLCVTASAPPSMARLRVEPMPSLPYVMPSILATHMALLTAAPLPARGPPAFA